MWLRVPCVCLLAACLLVAIRGDKHDKKRYDGYKVITVDPRNSEGLEFLKALHEFDQLELDFWQEPVRTDRKVTICVPPKQMDNINMALIAAGLTYETRIEDLQALIDKERRSILTARRKADPDTFNLDTYHRFDDMNKYIEGLASTSPLCSLVNIGKSFEGRQLKALKIGSAGSNKLAIWIDGGIHAREWVASAVALYLIDRLVNEYETDPEVKWLIDTFDWYILPNANPDGYEYSRVRARMWRKTRSNFGHRCTGTDSNRNWDHHWMEVGASSNPCSDIYAGPKAFSEPENKAISDFIMANKKIWKAYVTLHSYGQYWLTPWGYTRDLPADYEELMRVARKGEAALHAVHGKRYTLGSSTRVLYAAAGGSDDWAKGEAGIKYSYTLELRDTGRYGFILPASQIRPNGEEIWAGIKEMATEIKGTLCH